MTDVGRDKILMVLTGSMNIGSIPTTPHSSTVTFSTSSAITQHPKRVRQANSSISKTNPLLVNLSEPLMDEEFYGAYPILEVIQQTQDPAATASDAS